jgi:transposase InsO family protein
MGNTHGMPWNTATIMSRRHEFVLLASQPGINFRQLCRRFGISAKTGYKWRQRFRCGGTAALADQSRRPKTSPGSCAQELALGVLALRREHPAWGGRKLRRRLQDLGHPSVPAASTCTQIVRRAGLLNAAATHPPFQRFERSAPNELWQMDFKGHFGLQNGQRCHPLTILDDHSRFNIALSARANQNGLTVQSALEEAFAQYGLPELILCDNAPPWGCADPISPYTRLTAWLLRLGVRVIHGRPYHPQTQGKDERFHRTLALELLNQHTWRDLAHCQNEFPRFRHCYNCERPHDALQGDTPASRYQPSVRNFPSALPAIEYPSCMLVRTLRAEGFFTFKSQTWYVGKAFAELPIGLRPSAQSDQQWEVYFCHHKLGLIDLNQPAHPKHTLRTIYSTPHRDSSAPLSLNP